MNHPQATTHPQPVVRSNGPGTGNHAAALTCPECGTDAVALVAVQTALVPADPHEPVNHVTIWPDARGVVQYDAYPTPGQDAANNRRPRSAQTFVCHRGGHGWANVTASPPQGRTITYRAQPTLPLR